jgi:hypothetical protein
VRILENRDELQAINELFLRYPQLPRLDLRNDLVVFFWTKCVKKSSENASEIDLPLPLS